MRRNRSESVPVKSISRQGICSARLFSIGRDDEAPAPGRTVCACRTPLLAAAILAVSIAAISLSAPTALARVIYWDPASSGAFGTVNNTMVWVTPLDIIWTYSDTGGSTRIQNCTTNLNDDCNFGGPVAKLGGGTVPVDIVNAGTISFNVISGRPIVLSGGQITLKDATSITNNFTTYTHTISSELAGAATSLTKAGPGAVILSGDNTYSGDTIVSAGTLILGSSLALQNSPLDTLNSVAGDSANGLQATVTALTMGGLTGDKDLASLFTTTSGGYDTVTALTLNPGTGVAPSYSGIIADGAAGMTLTKAGAGTQTLSGANIYTGATIVSGGTLTLDYSTQNNSRFADAAGLVLGGGTVNLSGGSHIETVASTTLAGGAPSGVTSSALGSVLQMKDIAHNVGATVDFGAANIASTSTANTNDILGAWATVGGTDWAINSGTDDGGAVGSSFITAYTGYTDIDAQGGGANPNIVNGSATNVRIQNDGVSGAIGLGAADTTVNTLLQSNAATAAVVDTAGGTLRTGGIMIGSGKEALTIGTGATPGALTAATDGGELVLINNNAAKTFTVNAVIANNGTLACPLTKAGAGTLVLAGANTHTGLTTVNAGVLKLGAAGTSVTPGAALDLNGFTLGTAEALTVNSTGVASGGALTNSGAAAAYSGPITLGSDSSIVANGNIALSNTGTITGATFDLTLGGAATGSSIAGGIDTASGALTKTGAGTWTLSGNNTYTGRTTVSDGTLALLGDNSSATGNTRVSSTGTLLIGAANNMPTGTLTLLGGNLDLRSDDDTNFAKDFIIPTGTTTINVDRAIGGSGTNGTHTMGTLRIAGQTLNVTGANGYRLALGAVTLTGNATFNPTTADLTVASVTKDKANRNLTLGGISADSRVSGAITVAGGLTKSGTGTWTLSGANNYTGATTVNAGTLVLGQGGSMGATAVSVNGTATYAMAGTSSGASVQGGSTLSMAIDTTLDLQDGYTNTMSFTGTGANALNGAGLYFDLGDTAGVCDTLALTGDATVTGTNTFYFNPLGTVATGTYTLISAASGLDGETFAIGTTLPEYTLTLDATSGVALYLNVALSAVPGDTNNDKVVDAADFITLKKNFGKSTGSGASAGDFDKTGTVDWADLSTLMSAMGPGGGHAPSVPDPATFGLLAIGALAMLRKRRKA